MRMMTPIMVIKPQKTARVSPAFSAALDGTGDERRELSSETEQTQTRLTAELLIRLSTRLNSQASLAAVNSPRGGGRLPLRPKRAAFQAAQASAPDALLPDNPQSSTSSPGLLLLRLCGLLLFRF